MTVHFTKIHPIQFKFGKVNDMLTFYSKQGDGWANIRINKYFKQTKTDDASGGVKQMTTSQQFEEAYIQLETMQEIKVEEVSNEYKFSIKCLLEKFQANNSTLRARHQKMFKKDTYEFKLIKELVLTMHFGFIKSLKKGWNHIYKAWLDKLKQHLKNTGNRSIKQIHLKRMTGIFSLDSSVKKICLQTEKNDLQEEIEDKDEKTTHSPDWDKVIYDIVQINSHKFSVKYSQISDIIGEEEWVDGEMNKLSNIGSHPIVNLSFGAGKKEKKNNTQSLLGDLSTHNKKAKKKGTEYSESNKSKDCLIVADHVIVMNHGMEWINYAKIIGINVNEDWAIVKWESTSKNDRVKLCDRKKV
jgi:hypothetical protein